MGAPTAVIQRKPEVLMPMQKIGGSYTFSNGSDLWLDRVAQEMETPADIELTADISYNPATRLFTLPVTLRSALNLSNLNLNLLCVIMEDGLIARQRNYFASESDPLLGEWGLGGRYGQATASGVTHNDVVRAVIGNSYAGTTGLLPQTMQAGTEYSPSRLIGATLPDVIDDPANAKVAILLIDANTGHILNAATVRLTQADGIITPSQEPPNSQLLTPNSPLSTPHSQLLTLNSQLSTPHSLQGQRLIRPQRGPVILNGKLLIIK